MVRGVHGGCCAVGLLLTVFSTLATGQEVLPYSTWGSRYELGVPDNMLKHPSARALPPVATASAPLPPMANPTPRPALTGHARNAIRFYNGGSSRSNAEETLRSMPTRVAGRATRGPARPASKPFQSASRGATVSPYLNLYLDEQSEAAPNYFAFVRPQLEQQDANQRAQTELLRLRRQMQGASNRGAGIQQTGHSQPTRGGGTRFLDTGQYYGGFSR